jgi:hypothetical protein
VSDVGSSVFFFVKKKKSQENPEKDNLNILLACWKGADRECRAQANRFLGWAQGQSRKQWAAGRKSIVRHERGSDIVGEVKPWSRHFFLTSQYSIGPGGLAGGANADG